jgi:hypothetical protein
MSRPIEPSLPREGNSPQRSEYSIIQNDINDLHSKIRGLEVAITSPLSKDTKTKSPEERTSLKTSQSQQMMSQKIRETIATAAYQLQPHVTKPHQKEAIVAHGVSVDSEPSIQPYPLRVRRSEVHQHVSESRNEHVE